MRQRISKIVGSIGLVLGLAVIGGSIVGGIALATDQGGAKAPAVTGGYGSATDDKQGDDAGVTDDDATMDDDSSTGDDMSEGEDVDDDDCDQEDSDDAAMSEDHGDVDCEDDEHEEE